MIALSAGLLLQASPARGQIDPEKVLAGTDVEELIGVLIPNADINGDIVLGLAARDRLAALGLRDPLAVVPAVVAALSDLSTVSRAEQQSRIALIGVLSDIGPGAEDAVPLLSAIASGANERNEFVKQQASLALANIGTPDANAARDVAAARAATTWAAEADDAMALRAAEEHAFLIRQELRSTEPTAPAIEASLGILEAGGMRMAAAIPTLLRAWSDPRISVALRQRVGSILLGMGVEEPTAAASRLAPVEMVDDIVVDTRSLNPLVSSLAMMELGRLGASPRAIAVFTEALHEGRNPGAAALELGQFGAAAVSAVSALVPYLDDDSAGPNAAMAVGRIGDPDGLAVEELRRIVARPASRHRGLAAAALGTLAAPEAVPELVTALHDGRTQTRVLAARALGTIGPDASEAVTDLAVLLADPDDQVRIAAATALGRIGAESALAVPEMAPLLEAGDARVRGAATAALQAIGDPTAQQALARDAVRYAAADATRYRSIRQSAPGRVDSFLRELPEARRSQMALIAAADDEFDVAFLGAWTLVETGGAAVGALASLITRHDQGLNLLGALVSADRDALAREVIDRLRTIAETMTGAERERVNRALATVGENPL